MHEPEAPGGCAAWERLGDLQHTGTEFGVRLLRLSGAAAEGCLQRLLRLSGDCGASYRRHLEGIAAGARPEKLATAPARIASECGDAWYTEAQNIAQIVHFTQHEMLYWLERLTREWVRVCTGSLAGCGPR